MSRKKNTIWSQPRPTQCREYRFCFVSYPHSLLPSLPTSHFPSPPSLFPSLPSFQFLLTAPTWCWAGRVCTMLNISLISRPPWGLSGPFCMTHFEQFPVSLLPHNFTPFKLLSLSLENLAYNSDSGGSCGLEEWVLTSGDMWAPCVASTENGGGMKWVQSFRYSRSSEISCVGPFHPFCASSMWTYPPGSSCSALSVPLIVTSQPLDT